MEIRALAQQAAEQLSSYPSVTAKERCKRLLKSGVLRQKTAPIDRFSWPCAMLGEGLLEAFSATGENAYLIASAGYLQRWKTRKFPIYYVDNIMNANLALRIEDAVLQGGENSFSAAGRQELLEICKEAQKACADWIVRSARTPDGILAYRQHHPDWVFADTLGMVCPFLCGYGVQKGEASFVELGVKQLMRFVEKGMDAKTGLPYHGYDEKTGLKYGIIGWGRACGWMLTGLEQSLRHLPKSHSSYGELLRAFQRLAASCMAWQRADGGLSWQLCAAEGPRDSSAEAMIGLAVARGRAAGLLQDCAGEAPDFYGSFTGRLRKRLESSCVQGRMGDCSGECRGFAEYPQNYGCYPWGTGGALAFFAAEKSFGKD